ncbi:MAG: hypothetical protein IPH38_18510 [Candidatus Microthrix sp.]|nr:hypothetical protein [Candidatus Microthrix sp.]MBK7021527.1 hypothetical protein [Candidatus Microthrix sp.]
MAPGWGRQLRQFWDGLRHSLPDTPQRCLDQARQRLGEALLVARRALVVG